MYSVPVRSPRTFRRSSSTNIWATGKPIVSTREPLQVEDFKDVVYIARNPEMFLPLCDAAAKENRPAWTEKRLAYGAQCSWTERVHQMEEVLYKKGVLHESAEE